MKKRILSLLPLALVLAVFLCTPAFALTESEVEAQVAVSSKAAVTGNVLIWFLCAVAFLKVSQKIDSFMAGMGVNVGRTGGSLMAEAMIAARGVSMLVKAGGGAIGAMSGGGRRGGSSSGAASSGSTGGFFKGGLIGMAGRHITNSAVKTATTQTSAVNTAQKQTASSATHTATSAQSTGSHTASSVHSGGTHTANSVQFGGADPDGSGVIQPDSTSPSATIQTDSSAVFDQEHTSSDSQFTILRREHLLLDSAPHSAQFKDLAASLLRLFSTTGIIPAMSAGDIQLYSTLALLHDVGKKAIPPEILNKPGRLTREEFEVMKTHTIQGCGLVEQAPGLRECEAFPLICDVCRHHHERWDGSGYPDRLAGAEITPWVQVVGMADAFDALIHPRIYKSAFSQQQAAAMIADGACGAFDPLMLTCFRENIGPISRAVYG